MDTNYDATCLSPQRRRSETARSAILPGAPLNPDVDRYIKAFIPKWTEPDLLVWHSDLAELTKEWVSLAGPPTDVVALRLLSITAAFSLWAYKSFGSFNPKTIWDPKAIEHFVFAVNKAKSNSWKAAARSHLRRLGPIIHPKGIWAHPPDEISRGPVKPPYSKTEESAFRETIRRSPSSTYQRQLFLYAAGFGAGLASTELPDVKGEDVKEFSPGQLVIDLTDSGADRLVYVRRSLGADLSEAVQLSTHPHLIGIDPTQRGVVSRVASTVSVSGIGTLSVSRMRSTWICRHLEHGTPLLLLLEMAGLTSANTILQLAKHVGIPNREAAIATALEVS